MATISWTREAELWLHDIYDYISQDNPSAAADVVSGTYQRAQVLASHPEIGHLYERAANRDIRILLYGYYRIAYLIKKNGDIDILGVFHGAMQISRYLFDVKHNDALQPTALAVATLRVPSAACAAQVATEPRRYACCTSPRCASITE